jgi:hypothetical protein
MLQSEIYKLNYSIWDKEALLQVISESFCSTASCLKM